MNRPYYVENVTPAFKNFVRTWDAVRQEDGWFTPQDIAARHGIHERRARMHLLRLALMDLVERQEYRREVGNSKAYRFRVIR